MPSGGHGDRLSPVDASFLQLESACAHMHVAWTTILSPGDAARPTIDEIRARVSARLAFVPRCRQRLLPAPLGLGEPRWVDDEHFDVAAHVVALSDPADALAPTCFAALRDALLSRPLDRTRPLWQLAIVPRLADGRFAVIGRVHHAMADGAAAMQVALLTLDGDDVGDGDRSAKSWRAAAAPNLLARALDPIAHGAELTSRAARDVVRIASRPRSAAGDALRDARRLAAGLKEDLLTRAPGSELNRDLGPRRTLVQHRVSLDDVRAVSRGATGTRNDVCVAAIAGALRAHALEHGRPAESLKAMVPVNMRRPRDGMTLGNRVSVTSVWLPLQLASPSDRLQSVRAHTARFKESARAQGNQTLISGIGLLPNALRAPVLRAAAPGRFNLTISSVPGPPCALFMHGMRLDEIYPVIPIAEGQTLSIGVLPYEGHLHFGLYADPDGFADATRLAELIDEELRALRRSRKPPAVAPRAQVPAVAPVATPANRSAVLTTAGGGVR
jgi:WS/DGAT/MGAT family acyltransferase